MKLYYTRYKGGKMDLLIKTRLNIIYMLNEFKKSIPDNGEYLSIYIRIENMLYEQYKKLSDEITKKDL